MFYFLSQQHRRKHQTTGGSTRWYLLLQASERQGVLYEVISDLKKNLWFWKSSVLLKRIIHAPWNSVHSEKLLKLATNISRDKLVSVGTCFGKFSKTQKFRLHITALDFLAPYAKVTMNVTLMICCMFASITFDPPQTLLQQSYAFTMVQWYYEWMDV